MFGTTVFASKRSEEKKQLSISVSVDIYLETNLSSTDVGSQAPGSSICQWNQVLL